MSVSATRGEPRRQAVHVSVRSSLIFVPRKATHYSASSTGSGCRPSLVFAKRVGVTVDDERCATDLKRRREGGELFKLELFGARHRQRMVLPIPKSVALILGAYSNGSGGLKSALPVSLRARSEMPKSAALYRPAYRGERPSYEQNRLEDC